jgi:hypothetical protein
MAGIRNFGPLRMPVHVSDAADRSADRRAAFLLTMSMSAIAISITLVFVVRPI